MELITGHSFGQGLIIHKRTRDTENFFQYQAPYLCLDLKEQNSLPFFCFME